MAQIRNNTHPEISPVANATAASSEARVGSERLKKLSRELIAFINATFRRVRPRIVLEIVLLRIASLKRFASVLPSVNSIPCRVRRYRAEKNLARD